MYVFDIFSKLKQKTNSLITSTLLLYAYSETCGPQLEFYNSCLIFTETVNTLEVNRDFFALHMSDCRALRPKLGILDTHD